MPKGPGLSKRISDDIDKCHKGDDETELLQSMLMLSSKMVGREQPVTKEKSKEEKPL